MHLDDAAQVLGGPRALLLLNRHGSLGRLNAHPTRGNRQLHLVGAGFNLRLRMVLPIDVG